MRETAFVWHELYMWHDTSTYAGLYRPGLTVQPLQHYESPEPKRRIRNLLEVSGLLDQLQRVAPSDAEDADLLRVHTADYLAKTEAARGQNGLADAESPFGAASVDIARKAAGGAISAVKAVLAGQADNAYALIRPPGHHAEPDAGGGFCIFSNAAVAAAWALDNGCERVAIIDWDVHHGNGTESCFWEEGRVLAISLHQDNWFPQNRGAHTDVGAGAGLGKNMNLPLMPGCGHGAYVYAFEQIVLPALEAFRPDLIMVACGFDSSIEDPLGRMMLHADSYRTLTQMVLDAAERLCGGRVVFTHEGGYNPATTPFLGLAVVETLSGRDTGISDPSLPAHLAAAGQDLQPQQRAHIDALRAFFQQQPGCPLAAEAT